MAASQEGGPAHGSRANSGTGAPLATGLQDHSEQRPTALRRSHRRQEGAVLPELSNPPPEEGAKLIGSRQCTNSSSQNLFPRFTRKDKYVRPARTGVRAKQRRDGPCQLPGLIYSSSNGISRAWYERERRAGEFRRERRPREGHQ